MKQSRRSDRQDSDYVGWMDFDGNIHQENKMREVNMEMNIQNHNSYLLIDLDLIRRNARVILEGLKPGTELIPVLKDDAYGLGLIPVARALCELPEIRRLSVAHVSEGLELRAAGIDREVLVMGAALPFQMAAAADAELTLACPRPGFLSEYGKAAEQLGKRARVQIKIDTGLHRIGLETGDLDDFIGEYAACADRVDVTGVFSHFSDVAYPAICEREYAAFLGAIEKLKAGGVPVPMRHMACSASSERWPKYNLDADMCEAYRKDIISRYPFPVWKDELFAPEQLCLDRMALDGYYLRWYSKAVYRCDYLEDGLTKGSWDLIRNNKMGYAMLSNLKMLTTKQRKKQFKEAAKCIALSIAAGHPSYIFRSNRPWMTLAALPYGLLLSLRRRRQFRHDDPPGRKRRP